MAGLLGPLGPFGLYSFRYPLQTGNRQEKTYFARYDCAHPDKESNSQPRDSCPRPGCSGRLVAYWRVIKCPNPKCGQNLYYEPSRAPSTIECGETQHKPEPVSVTAPP